MAKSVVASFDSFAEAQRVYDELCSAGIPESDISIIGNRTGYGSDSELPLGSRATDSELALGSRATDGGSTADVSARASTLPPEAPASMSDTGKGAAAGAATGGLIGGAAGLAAALMGLTIPGIGPIVAAGPLAAALAGAGVGAVAGGLIGGLTTAGVPENMAHMYAEAVRRGGAVVLVRAEDDPQADRAADIMRRHSPIDLDSRAEEWRAGGWSGYDESAAPYSHAQMREERDRFSDRAATGPVGGGGAALPVGAAAGFASPPATPPFGMATGAAGSSARDDMAADRAMLDATRDARQGVGASSDERLTDDPYRSHFNQHFSESGAGYEVYRPAYSYGEELRSDERYRGREWNEVEPAARLDWESRHGSGWDRFKAAVRHGWERTKDTAERLTPGDSDRDGR